MRLARAVRYEQRRHGRVARRRRPATVRVHRGQRPAPGGAHRDRGGHRRRHRPGPAAPGRRRDARRARPRPGPDAGAERLRGPGAGQHRDAATRRLGPALGGHHHRLRPADRARCARRHGGLDGGCRSTPASTPSWPRSSPAGDTLERGARSGPAGPSASCGSRAWPPTPACSPPGRTTPTWPPAASTPVRRRARCRAACRGRRPSLPGAPDDRRGSAGGAGLAGARLDSDDPLAVLAPRQGRGHRLGRPEPSPPTWPTVRSPSCAPMQGTIIDLGVGRRRPRARGPGARGDGSHEDGARHRGRRGRRGPPARRGRW